MPVTFLFPHLFLFCSLFSCFSDAASQRANILKLMSDASVDSDTMISKASNYISILMGFVNPPENSQETTNKLRGAILFKWSNSAEAKHSPPVIEPDALFEVCSMLFTVALWLTKHAAKVAAKDEVSQDEAKDVHLSLRQAAGIFLVLKEKYTQNLLAPPKPGHDLHTDILDAYIYQSTAEAQEITVARAIELKHDAGLIASLAKETAAVYEKSGFALKPYDLKVMGKWLKYLEFKKHCYDTCAYVYYAEHLLKQEKAGVALAVIAEAEKTYKQSLEVGKAYARADGVGLSAKPADHCFFRRLGTMVESTRRKLERENGIIFHQRVPTAAPTFDLKAKFGIAEPKTPDIDFTPDPRWKDAYNGFNETKLLESITTRDARAKQHKEKTDRDAPVEPIPEKPIFHTDKDPKTDSGCVLS
ncbi:hypothetical protein EG68_06562 [Paragonimus skrjabini miyazakii]|uniref:BRO1 domain-containing protein n=1 Tax=Paragonimus skrjabini miyazakii TaxID=59628 RepID=A0A8S9YT81_9TREM|nr:hypothetical protein EG68_06562 [Paragonimus skrjabini miyazakii]